jgi:hypothetical protein
MLTLGQLHRESVLVKPVNTPITALCSKFSLHHLRHVPLFVQFPLTSDLAQPA